MFWIIKKQTFYKKVGQKCPTKIGFFGNSKIYELKCGKNATHHLLEENYLSEPLLIPNLH